jgi:CheY-like chemotaxis protein
VDVLIVEDDRSTRDLLGLQAADGSVSVRIITASDGYEALDRLAEQARIGLILLDLGLPGLDGFGFLFRLRRVLGDRSPPVVVVTARDLSRAEHQRLRSLGVVRVLQKGRYDTQALVDTVAAWAC